MARYDVYPNPDGAGYLLDVQADILEMLNTRIVVPLIPLVQAPAPAKRLNPVFDIAGEPCAMMTQFMAAVPAGLLLGAVINLVPQAEDITNALDMVFFGF